MLPVRYAVVDGRAHKDIGCRMSVHRMIACDEDDLFARQGAIDRAAVITLHGHMDAVHDGRAAAGSELAVCSACWHSWWSDRATPA